MTEKLVFKFNRWFKMLNVGSTKKKAQKRGGGEDYLISISQAFITSLKSCSISPPITLL